MIATILFVGGINAGAGPDWLRLPGPYLVSGSSRSIEPEGVDAALWSRQFLGPNNRVAADRINQLLMATYGGQRIITRQYDHVEISLAYLAPAASATATDVLQQSQSHYIVVDWRLTTALPREGIYFDASEPGAPTHTSPLPQQAFTRFEVANGVNRLFDSGDINIYDVSAMEHS
jgi:hypothetical protein